MDGDAVPVPRQAARGTETPTRSHCRCRRRRSCVSCPEVADRAVAVSTYCLLCLARSVERDRLPNECLKGGFVNVFSLADVDRAANVSVEARVEETTRILQRRTLCEGELHHALVGFARTNNPVVRPCGSARVRGFDPLQLLDYVRVGFLDDCSNSSESLSAPVSKVSDSCRDQLRCRLILVRGRLLHGLLPLRQFRTYGSTNMERPLKMGDAR